MHTLHSITDNLKPTINCMLKFQEQIVHFAFFLFCLDLFCSMFFKWFKSTRSQISRLLKTSASNVYWCNNPTLYFTAFWMANWPTQFMAKLAHKCLSSLIYDHFFLFHTPVQLRVIHKFKSIHIYEPLRVVFKATCHLFIGRFMINLILKCLEI